MTTIYINGVLQGVDMHDDENYMLYVSPYMTVNADRFTKYYYAGTQRIASKLGSGKFDNVYGVNGFHLTAGGKDYAERSVQMVKGVQDYYRQAGVTPGVPNEQGQHANPYISGVAYPSVPLGDYSVPKGWPGALDRRQRGDVFGPPVNFLREAPQEAKAGVGFKSDHQREDNLFYFHTDYLGSTSYLTDTVGNVSQFVWYAPYGEALVDEHTTTYENPFKFSGKELDDITGLYDHGARNRNPITAVWYGIDELFEKYPENGPYGYCGGNPVKFVDLDGRDMCINPEDSKARENARDLYKHLRKITKSKRFTLKISPNGKLGYSFEKGKMPWQKRPWGKARKIQKIIDDKSINVNLIATSYEGKTPPLEDLNNDRSSMYAGAFGGSEVIDGVRTTTQYLSYNQLIELDKTSESTEGTSVMHEITESCIGGKIADELGMSVVKPALDKYKDTPDYQIYKRAHKEASPQPEIMEFDNNGEKIYRLIIDTPNGVKFKDLNNY